MKKELKQKQLIFEKQGQRKVIPDMLIIIILSAIIIALTLMSNPTTPIDDCMTNHNDDCDKRGVGGITMVMIELLQVKNKEMAGFDVHAPRRAFNFQCQKCL